MRLSNTRRRRGFSIPELLTVLVIMGLLVRIGMPKLWDLRRRASARAMIGDVVAIRVAAYNFNTEKGTWPTDAGAGMVPTELVPLLPQQFPFTRTDWTLDFDVWQTAGGLSGGSASSDVVGIAVDSPDAALVAALRQSAGGMPIVVSGSKTTFLIAGIGGNY